MPARRVARRSAGAGGRVKHRRGRRSSRTARAILATAIGLLVPAAAVAIEADIVVLQGLDKVTARVSTFEARVGETVRFGTLEIRPRYCDRTPPEEPPESAAFLDIYEAKPGEERIDLFHGWMFASSPALNPLEHPVYDVWVLECKRTQPDGPPAAPELQR